MSNLSVLILTYNEEINISDCISSVSFCDDVVVLDSLSDDRTTDIAGNLNARIFYKKFQNYADQRNYGLNLDFKHDWILMLDADELVDESLRVEILSVISNSSNECTLFRVRRKDFFFGKWIKRSSGYPTWFGRLFLKGHVSVKRDINEEYYTDGKVGCLQNHLIHYPFKKGLDHWFYRHNIYSTSEALVLAKNTNRRISYSEFFSFDPMLRRKVAKQIVYKMKFRPFFILIYLYIFRLGFLDGLPGFYFSLMRFYYEFMISMKILEFKKKEDLI